MSQLGTAKAFAQLDRQLNNLFGVPFSYFAGRTEDLGLGYRPAIDIYEDENGFYLYADLPGFSQENLQVRYENRTLTISGERKTEEIAGRRYHRTESFTGRFQRAFSIPIDIEVEKIEAEFKNGLLVVTLPKQEASKPRQIEVKLS